MPRFTQYCPVCGWQDTIIVQPFVKPPCPHCGQPTDRLWTGTSASVAGDEFPGGKTFENLGNEPVTVYSRSELRREMKARGLQEFVRHVPVPGSDKSPHTTSWDVPSPYTLEQARILLERVGRPSLPDPPKPEDAGNGPYATPLVVKEVLERWPR